MNEPGFSGGEPLVRRDQTRCVARPSRATHGFAGRLWGAGNNQLVFSTAYPAQTYADALIPNRPALYLRACTP